MINLNQFAREMLAVAKKREENGAAIKTDTVSMLKHTATEVVEAMESYTKKKSLISTLQNFSLERKVEGIGDKL